MKPDLQLRDGVFGDVVYGLQNDVFQDPVSMAVLRAYSLGARDDEITGMLQHRVHRARIAEVLGKTAPFRIPRTGRGGSLVLGHDLAGKPVSIEPHALNAGRVDAGSTGSGKTTVLKNHILQVAPRVPGAWFSDLYKSDLRHLRPLLAKRGVDLVILRPPDLRLNLLQADCDPRVHLAMAIDVLQRVLDLPARAVSILKAILHYLYKEYGIYHGKTTHWPVLHDVYERVRAIPGLNAPAREAILDRLGSLLVALTPEVAAWRHGWRPSDLARHHIVFELRGANEHVKSLHLSQLLFSTLYRRAERGRSNARLDLVVAFEDAQRFFRGASSEEREIPPIEELAGLVRGMGVSLWASLQSLDGVPRGLLANLTTKFMYRLGTSSDYTQLGADLGMTRKQIDWARVNLRPGLCIVQLADGPWRLPFVIRVPNSVIPPVVDEEEIQRSAARLKTLRTVPAAEYQNWEPNHVLMVTASDDRIPRATPEDLSEAEVRLLQAVIEHPGQPSGAYAKLAAMNARRAVISRERLVSLGYLREHAVATGKRGRNAIILEPTEKATQRAVGLHTELGVSP